MGAHDDEQGAGIVFQDALEREGGQFFACYGGVGGFDAIDKGVLGQGGSLVEAFDDVIGTGDADGGFDARFKSGGARSEVATQADTHDANTTGVDVGSTFEVIDSIA